VDFEFPDENGKPYKSSGGLMVWNDELGREIPKGWGDGMLGGIGINKKEGIKKGNLKNKSAYIGLEHMPKQSIALNNWEIVGTIESNKMKFNQNDILFGKLRPYFHKVGIAQVDGACSTDIVVIYPKTKSYFGFLTMVLSSKQFVDYTTAGSGGTKMPRTNWNYMSEYKTVYPTEKIIKRFNSTFGVLYKKIKLNTKAKHNLSKLEKLLLSKIAKA